MFTEQQLLIDLKAGDEKAVAKWFELYHNRLTKVAIKMVESRNDAEEIVQETFLNCLKHLPLFRGQSSIWTWMNSILRHEVADYFRKKYAKKALKTIPITEFFMVENLNSSSDINDQVKFILKSMKKESQELLMLKYVDGKKVEQIAKILGKSPKAIESEIYRARTEFKKLWNLEIEEFELEKLANL